MQERRSQPTLLECPDDHGARFSRSTPTRIGHVSTAEVEAKREPERPSPPRSAPWSETVYISPSGRIFLPPGFDCGSELPATLTARTVRREPPIPRPEPRRAHVVIGHVPHLEARPRTITRESWVVPPHLQPS